jgi:hypothetical protein
MYRDKSKATTEPVAAVADLKGLWDREFGVYRPVVAKVTGRKGSMISFEIIIDPDGSTDGATYTVDLDDGGNVWGDLPSTAQLVDPTSEEQIGYLLLNQNWIYENVTSGRVAPLDGPGDPPKIPKNYSL